MSGTVILCSVDESSGRARAASEEPPMRNEAVVRGAGGVIARPGRRGDAQVLLVCRVRRMRDWSFPKGKVEAGETDECCALREVREETNLTCALGIELPAVSYRDRRGQLKRVRYWTMRVIAGRAAARNEVQAVRWLDLESAAGRLTYPHDRQLLAAFAGLLEAPEASDAGPLPWTR
jgi:8-oxo-dGTP diphosphatase